MVRRPRLGPGKDDEQHSSDGTDQNKKKYRDAMHPDLHGTVRRRRVCFERGIEQCGGRLSLWPRGLWRLAGRVGKGPGIRHRRLREETAGQSRQLAPGPEGRKLGRKAIGLFYDFRALMRSATSR